MQANSASNSQWDMNVPAKGQWQCCAAGKVTVGPVSHWVCVTDSVVDVTHGLSGLRKGDE